MPQGCAPPGRQDTPAGATPESRVKPWLTARA